jgi:hypothetical protein
MNLSIEAQAFVNLLLKFTIAIAIFFAVIGLAVLVPTNLLIGSTSVLVMLYCMYNLYQIELMRLKAEQDTKFDQK